MRTVSGLDELLTRDSAKVVMERYANNLYEVDRDKGVISKEHEMKRVVHTLDQDNGSGDRNICGHSGLVTPNSLVLDVIDFYPHSVSAVQVDFHADVSQRSFNGLLLRA